jgi:hypothetical protein
MAERREGREGGDGNEDRRMRGNGERTEATDEALYGGGPSLVFCGVGVS